MFNYLKKTGKYYKKTITIYRGIGSKLLYRLRKDYPGVSVILKGREGAKTFYNISGRNAAEVHNFIWEFYAERKALRV